MEEAVQLVIVGFREEGIFTPQEVQLDEDVARKFVRLRGNPQRFVKSVFDGEWASPTDNPAVGTIRLLRVIAGSDGVYRVIARQGRALYAYPWI